MSQTDQILKHMKRGRPINPIQALRDYGCFRLSARILDLKQQGHNIETNIITRGEKRYASYRLVRG
jgi:hypothetical protein